MINAAIIGYGYWGPNIARNFNAHPEIKVLKICDFSKERLKNAKESYPNIEFTTDPNNVLTDKNIDLVAVITPVSSHYDLAKKALLNGKHVFVEKPFTSNSDQAKELITIANKNNLTIMVDHTFLFTSAVKKIKEFIDDGILGDLFYYNSVRVNLGLFQHDVNVIWDLAPHDIAIMNYLIDDMVPYSVNAIGSDHFHKGLEDVAYLHVKYENNFIGSFNVNWLSPVKIRQSLIAGEKKMLVWDDLASDEKIKIYDKGIDVDSRKGVYNLLVGYRSGDMWSPQIINVEALKLETQHLVDCINSGERPINDGINGLKVVRILEASEKSIKNGGREIIIE